MAKRVSGLDPQTIADGAWVLEIDEPTGSTQETEKITADELRQIMGALPDNSKVDLTLTTSVGAVPSSVVAKSLNIGKAFVVVLNFDLDFGGTDPVISLNTVLDSNLIIGQAAICSINSGGDTGLHRCLLTDDTPANFTIYGTFNSGGVRNITISATLI